MRESFGEGVLSVCMGRYKRRLFLAGVGLAFIGGNSTLVFFVSRLV